MDIAGIGKARQAIKLLLSGPSDLATEQGRSWERYRAPAIAAVSTDPGPLWICTRAVIAYRPSSACGCFSRPTRRSYPIQYCCIPTRLFRLRPIGVGSDRRTARRACLHLDEMASL